VFQDSGALVGACALAFPFWFFFLRTLCKVSGARAIDPAFCLPLFVYSGLFVLTLVSGALKAGLNYRPGEGVLAVFRFFEIFFWADC